MSERPAFVLDSFAVLAHLQDERGQGLVLQRLEQARRGEIRLLLSLINLGEAAYLIERRRGLRAAQLALAALDALPIKILPANREAVLAAAHLKARYPISFADAFAAAAAQACSAILLTGDPEFQALQDVVAIEWLPLSG